MASRRLAPQARTDACAGFSTLPSSHLKSRIDGYQDIRYMADGEVAERILRRLEEGRPGGPPHRRDSGLEKLRAKLAG